MGSFTARWRRTARRASSAAAAERSAALCTCAPMQAIEAESVCGATQCDDDDDDDDIYVNEKFANIVRSIGYVGSQAA